MGSKFILFLFRLLMLLYNHSTTGTSCGMCEALGRTLESFLSLLRHEPMDCVSQRLLQAEKDPVSYRGLQNFGKPGRSHQEVAQGQGARFLVGGL